MTIPILILSGGCMPPAASSSDTYQLCLTGTESQLCRRPRAIHLLLMLQALI